MKHTQSPSQPNEMQTQSLTMDVGLIFKYFFKKSPVYAPGKW